MNSYEVGKQVETSLAGLADARGTAQAYAERGAQPDSP